VERQIGQLDMENVWLLLALYQEGKEKQRAEDEDFTEGNWQVPSSRITTSFEV
jgi:hypothetical protein